MTVFASLTWNPGMFGIVAFGIAVCVLGGTVLILLATNTGIRLGFHLALTGLFGVLTLIFGIWLLFPVDIKGPAPAWKVVEVNSAPARPATGVAQSLPPPDQLPSPQELIRQNHLESQFANQQRPANLSDVVAADPALAKQLDQHAGGWRLLATSDKTASESSSVAVNYLMANNKQAFPSQDSMVVLVSYDRGGKPSASGSGVWDRVTNRIQKTAMWFIGDNPTHYAVAQIRPAIPQQAQAGESPPTPAPDLNQPVINVIMVRDLGALRQPSAALFFIALVCFIISATSLHRRDKRSMAARAAAAPPLPEHLQEREPVSSGAK